MTAKSTSSSALDFFSSILGACEDEQFIPRKVKDGVQLMQTLLQSPDMSVITVKKAVDTLEQESSASESKGFWTDFVLQHQTGKKILAFANANIERRASEEALEVDLDGIHSNVCDFVGQIFQSDTAVKEVKFGFEEFARLKQQHPKGKVAKALSVRETTLKNCFSEKLLASISTMMDTIVQQCHAGMSGSGSESFSTWDDVDAVLKPLTIDISPITCFATKEAMLRINVFEKLRWDMGKVIRLVISMWLKKTKDLDIDIGKCGRLDINIGVKQLQACGMEDTVIHVFNDVFLAECKACEQELRMVDGPKLAGIFQKIRAAKFSDVGEVEKELQALSMDQKLKDGVIAFAEVSASVE